MRSFNEVKCAGSIYDHCEWMGAFVLAPNFGIRLVFFQQFVSFNYQVLSLELYHMLDAVSIFIILSFSHEIAVFVYVGGVDLVRMKSEYKERICRMKHKQNGSGKWKIILAGEHTVVYHEPAIAPIDAVYVRGSIVFLLKRAKKRFNVNFYTGDVNKMTSMAGLQFAIRGIQTCL